MRSRTCFVCREQLIDAAEHKLGRYAGRRAPSDEKPLVALKVWRLEIANVMSQPALVVLANTTLQVIAEVEPMDRVQLLRISGIGVIRTDRFGANMLQVVVEHGARDADPAGG